MKNFITIGSVVIMSVLIMASSLFAQPGFGKGVKGGLNIANLGGSDIEGADSRTAFVFGVFVDVPLSDILSIQPEALYSMQGAKDKGDLDGTTADFTLKLDYIQIPVLVKVNVPVEGSNVKPSIFAGPALGINTTAKAKIESGGVSAEVDLKDLDAPIKSTDFSLVFGAGIGFGAGSMTIGFDARYWLGLSSIDDSAANGDIKNKVIQFMASLGF
jgi:hypothetical protein